MKKGIIYSFIISLVICMIMPFHIYADAWSDIFEGSTLSYEKNVYTWTFNKHVLGYFVPTITFKYTPNGAVNQIRPNINVNGTQVIYEISNEELYDVSYTVYSYSLKSVSDMDLTEVIQYLSEIYDNQEDIIDQLVLIYGKTETLTQLRHWNFPIESFTAIYPFMLKYTPKDITTYNSYTYPLFEVKQGDVMFNSLYTNSTYYDTTLIFGIDYLLYNSNFDSFLTPTTNDYTRTEPQTISRVLISSNPNVWYQIVRIDYHYTGSGTNPFGIQFNRDFKILPIYWNLKRNKYLSTDFALQYGLSNQLLDDLHIVAQGTQQSNSAAGDLEQGNSDLASDISSYNQIESDYNNQMNQALNNIDLSDQFSNNQNFLSGASFVKTVFNSFMQIDILRIFFIVLCIILIAKRFI